MCFSLWLHAQIIDGFVLLPRMLLCFRAAYGAPPHEAAATNLQLVRHHGYAPGSEGAAGGTPQRSAEGAAPATDDDNWPPAPATTQAAPLVNCVAAAPAYL